MIVGRASFCSDTCHVDFYIDKSAGDDGCWPWLGCLNDGGYGSFTSKSRRTTLAHRFVLEAVEGRLPSHIYACHRCDNPPCCNPRHLFAGTAIDNNKDRDKKGRRRFAEPRNRARGERGTAVLTTAIVIDIVKDAQNGMTQTEIAHAHGVSQTNVSSILRGKTWKHVPRPIVSTGRGGYANNGIHQRRREDNHTA